MFKMERKQPFLWECLVVWIWREPPARACIAVSVLGLTFSKGIQNFVTSTKTSKKPAIKNGVRKDFELPESGSRLFSLYSWVQLFKEASNTCPKSFALAKYNRNSLSFLLLWFCCTSQVLRS